MTTPTTLTHPLYNEWLSAWQDCRNAYAGQRAIKAAGTRYLPQLTGQDATEYNAYKERALFFSITSKTISALVGMALQRPPIFKVPESMEKYGLDTYGTQLIELVCASITEVLMTGRFGLLIDMPVNGGDPFMARYGAENIINWVVDREGKPSRVVLKEIVFESDVSDPNAQSSEVQFRVLFINAAGQYQVDMYDDNFSPKTQHVPTVNNQPLTYIPFVLMNPVGLSWEIIKPPVLDIVDINISHYRTSADLEHGRHYTGLPTPVVSGVDGGTILKIGSQTAWVLPDANSKAYYLEFTGEGLKSLETALAEKQSQLASLSARLMDNSHKGSEAVDAVRLRFMSETASLLMVVLAIEDGLSTAHKLIAQIKGEDPKAVYLRLNREFLSSKLSASEILALTKSYLEGGLTVETFVYNLRRGDMLPHDKDDKTIITDLEKAKKDGKPPSSVISGLPDAVKPNTTL